MKYSLFYFFTFYFFISSFSNIKNIFQSKITIQIENKSKFKVSAISIFSIYFNDLLPNEKSQFKDLDYNWKTDDGMLYLTANELRFALYIVPDSLQGSYVYQIDSFNFKNRYIYMTKIKNNTILKVNN